MLKKGAFKSTKEAFLAFDKLKLALISAPILALPDFNSPFIVDFDASQSGLGVVLLQMKKPIEYFSKSLNGKNRALSVYNKELLALVLSAKKWKSYLLGRQFVVKADNMS